MVKTSFVLEAKQFGEPKTLAFRNSVKSSHHLKLLKLSQCHYLNKCVFSQKMDAASMKVVELKAFCKSNGLATKGNKVELVQRVMNFKTGVSSEDLGVSRGENNPPPSVTPTIKKGVPDSDSSIMSDSLKMENENLNPDESIAKSEDTTEEEQVASNELPSSIGLKRKNSSAYGSRKRFKGPPTPKTPLMILNELKPGLQFEVSVGGVKHNMVFNAKVVYEGQEYCAQGSSKKSAKQNAAAAVLRSVVQFENPEIVTPILNYGVGQMDFTSDEIESFLDPQPVSPLPYTCPPAIKTPMPRKEPNDTEGKNPVMLLNELISGLHYECVEETGNPKSKMFTMEVEVHGNKYKGYGKNKKLAKVGAATKALLHEFKMTTRPADQHAVPSNADGENSDLPSAGNLPDLVYGLVRKKFSELTNDFTSENAKLKVLAGIVMTRDNGPDVSTGDVVSLATGTKCVSGEFISDQGAALFDCHAEIVSKRGLRRFLYQQLMDYPSDKINSIFEKLESGKFQLKTDVYFHLYISTSPCGDARIFSPHEVEQFGDDHPNRKSRGQLRTKIENGEGTIPVDDSNYVKEKGKDNFQQTWDGVISGDRLLTMSCSDKVAKWNVVGLQGSLLSHMIQPVYLSSIVLGSLYHAKHLQRAVFVRAKEAMNAILADDVKMPDGYRVHRPLLAAISSKECRVAKKAPAFCLHWSHGDTESHIICTNTGRKEDGSSSNLCKSEMLRLFSETCKKHEQTDILKDADEPSYADLKQSATDYQKVKNLLMKGFQKTKCGSWIGKPSEVDLFSSR